MKSRDFSADIIQRYYKEDPKAHCRNITFQVTDDCCLKCSYCYQTHKGHAMMSKDVAKAAVNLLFKLYDENDENMVINHHTYGIVLDMIGGEPFMNVDIMDFIVDYFIQQCYERDHIWLTNFRISISTNGLLYFEPKVQAFLNKYASFISMNVTIDGPKDVHDLCRVDYNGAGSFDRAMAAWNDWFIRRHTNPPDTKVTIAPENLPKMGEIFEFFLSKGCTSIHANPIFEHKWTEEEASLYYKLLIKLADRLLEVEGAESSLFSSFKGEPLPASDTNNWCGGTSAMLAFDPQGQAYPCLRYMASSLGPDRKPIVIGNTNGIYNTPEYRAIYDDMQKVTRQSQSTQECLDCPVASGCAWCFPAGTKISTPTGLKNIEDIQVNDKVLDMYGNPQNVENIMKHIDNDVVSVRAAGFRTINVTANHPFYCKPVVRKKNNLPIYGEPQWIAAKDLRTTDRIALFTPKPGNQDINKDFAYIIGRYVGDGWKTDSKREAHPYRYYICTAFEEQEEFEEHLNNSGITYSKYANRTVEEYNLHINLDLMVPLLDDCGRGAKNKHVPRAVWDWNEESIKAFLHGYFDADGCIDTKTDVQRFTSVSFELIQNICELVRIAYHKSPSITFRKSKGKSMIEGRLVNNSDSYEGRFYWREPVHKYYEYDEENNIMWVNVREEPCSVTKLEVYNLTVADTHSYIANGAIVHNCSAANYDEFGTYNKRSTNICWMHRAEALAGVYYWNKYYRMHNMTKRKKMYLPVDIAMHLITLREYNELLLLSST